MRRKYERHRKFKFHWRNIALEPSGSHSVARRDTVCPAACCESMLHALNRQRKVRVSCLPGLERLPTWGPRYGALIVICPRGGEGEKRCATSKARTRR